MTSLHLMRRLLIGAVAALSLSLPAHAADPGITDNEIVIGLFGPLSGPLIAYGIDPVNAAKMIYDDVNAKGGINGRKIRLVIEDDKCTGNDLVTVVKKLVTVDHVFLLNGGSCTAAVAAAQDYVNREKVPLVMLNAAGDNAVFPPTRYVFGSFQGTQRVYGAALAEFAAKTLKAKRVAIIVHDDDYGKANLAAATAVTEKNGGQVVAAERIPPSITDVTAPVLNIRAAKPDVIISGAYPAPAVLIAQKYGEFGMSAIPLLQSTQGIPTPPVFAKNVGNDAALQNFYYTWAFTDVGDQAIHDKWVGMYKKAYPDRDPGAFMVTGIPSALAVTAALQKAGRDVTRESFVQAMEGLDLKNDLQPEPLRFGPQRRDALRGVFVIKYDGKTQKVEPGVYSWNGKDGT
ncbi:MAG TPA: ABC transporter substrate-binding protein [Stellaceae bacterium]|nr:ABC transporter substrate-binding protein [Stellaceae bacterium]